MSKETLDYLFYEETARKEHAKRAIDTFMTVTQIAFDTCVQNFATNALTSKEKKCITDVTTKHIGHSKRVTNRFLDVQQAAMGDQLKAAEARVAEARAAAGSK